MAASKTKSKVDAAIRFAHHAEHLSLHPHDDSDPNVQSTHAVEARFITPHDPVIETAGGDRLPGVPLTEAQKLNELKEEMLDNSPQKTEELQNEEKAENLHNVDSRAMEDFQDTGKIDGEYTGDCADGMFTKAETQLLAKGEGFGHSAAPLKNSVAPSRTNPLFPPLPLYGPPSVMRTLQCTLLRVTSFSLSLGFLSIIVLGSAFTSLPLMFQHIGMRLAGKNPDSRRPFYKEEKRLAILRRQQEREWEHQKRRRRSFNKNTEKDSEGDATNEEFVPTEGGKDPLVCDAGYYARRVGLDLEEFEVQTEDGFIITLWHVFNPKEYTPASADERRARKPEVFSESASPDPASSPSAKRKRRDAPPRYPVLLIHGLLQSAGAYCTNDDKSLAFYLAKAGYDVWLGNNRCGFRPQHTLLKYSDPRLWAYNIRQMGVMDLPALISRVLSETGFPKLGLICHSQGTTETFVALAKEQRPDLGRRISVFCALAPAVYAGPLIGKAYFKFMKLISPAAFRVVFGIHAFIPTMMTMHRVLPGVLYGAMGYRVFSFLFSWTDDRWDRGLRDRFFQFAPVYVSAESMRWWLGRECFAKHKCILATREEARKEDEEDDASDDDTEISSKTPESLAARAWYDEQAPPMAFWIAGSDKLVDGRRLLRRFERRREPHVRVVHSRLIPEYEHLDVLWAMDAPDKVATEVKQVVWKCAAPEVEKGWGVVVPKGCERATGRENVLLEKEYGSF